MKKRYNKLFVEWLNKILSLLGRRGQKMLDDDVLSDNWWNGVSSKGEICSQRFGCKKLYVSDVVYPAAGECQLAERHDVIVTTWIIFWALCCVTIHCLSSIRTHFVSLQDWWQLSNQDNWLWSDWRRVLKKLLPTGQFHRGGGEVASEVDGPREPEWWLLFREKWCGKTLNCTRGLAVYSTQWNYAYACSSLWLSIYLSVVIWCNNVGDIHWRKVSLPWGGPTHSGRTFWGWIPLEQTHQCCLQWWDVSETICTWRSSLYIGYLCMIQLYMDAPVLGVQTRRQTIIQKCAWKNLQIRWRNSWLLRSQLQPIQKKKYICYASGRGKRGGCVWLRCRDSCVSSFTDNIKLHNQVDRGNKMKQCTA